MFRTVGWIADSVFWICWCQKYGLCSIHEQNQPVDLALLLQAVRFWLKLSSLHPLTPVDVRRQARSARLSLVLPLAGPTVSLEEDKRL